MLFLIVWWTFGEEFGNFGAYKIKSPIFLIFETVVDTSMRNTEVTKIEIYCLNWPLPISLQS